MSNAEEEERISSITQDRNIAFEAVGPQRTMRKLTRENIERKHKTWTMGEREAGKASLMWNLQRKNLYGKL